MGRRITWFLWCAAIFISPSVQAQSIFSAGGSYAGAAGLGAGLSASMNHGRVVTRGYQAVIDAQQAALAQTKAVEQYMAAGCRFEAQKNWQNAERSFTYVLQLVARLDGPGSPKSVPALKHLVTVTAAQNKLDEAIGFQKTVLSFSQQGKDPRAINSAQIDLAGLFIKKEDYVSAEPVCSQAVQTVDAKIPVSQRRIALNTYAKVLRKLHKDSEATAVEAEALATEAKLETEAHNFVESSRAAADGKVPSATLQADTAQKQAGAKPEQTDASMPVTSGQPAALVPADSGNAKSGAADPATHAATSGNSSATLDAPTDSSPKAEQSMSTGAEKSGQTQAAQRDNMPIPTNNSSDGQ